MTPAEHLELLYDKTHQRLFRLGCRMTGDADAALDLVQETFLRAAGRPEAVPGRSVATIVGVLPPGFRAPVADREADPPEVFGVRASSMEPAEVLTR